MGREAGFSAAQFANNANCSGRNDKLLGESERTVNGNGRSRSPAGMTSKKSKGNNSSKGNSNNDKQQKGQQQQRQATETAGRRNSDYLQRLFAGWAWAGAVDSRTTSSGSIRIRSGVVSPASFFRSIREAVLPILWSGWRMVVRLGT
jgi:hypothetical protein